MDVEAFEAAATPPDENLVTAVQLYSGDLLEDIYDDWVERERDRLARLYRECLLRLINQQEQNGQFQNAIQYARQYLLAEPFRENTHSQLMRLYYLTGNRGGVKQTFEQLQNCFREELGAEPLPETAALYQTMLAGDYQSTESVNQSSHAKTTPTVFSTLCVTSQPRSGTAHPLFYWPYKRVSSNQRSI